MLDARCGDDADLRAEVESLLDAHDSEGMVPDITEERPFGGRYPERIGPYRIVRPLGEGGMGVVLLAIREGDGFEQTVALKVLRGAFADPLLARRLEEEPAYANLAELGLGVLGDFGLRPAGSILLDEKLGLHVAFGRSDHFGGTVGPSDFSGPDAVVHLDRVYIPETQPRVEVVEVRLLGPGLDRVLIAGNRYTDVFA